MANLPIFFSLWICALQLSMNVYIVDSNQPKLSIQCVRTQTMDWFCWGMQSHGVTVPPLSNKGHNSVVFGLIYIKLQTTAISWMEIIWLRYCELLILIQIWLLPLSLASIFMPMINIHHICKDLQLGTSQGTASMSSKNR